MKPWEIYAFCILALAVIIAGCMRGCSIDKEIKKSYLAPTNIANPISKSRDIEGKEHSVQSAVVVKDQSVIVAALRAENSRLRAAIVSVSLSTNTTYKSTTVLIHDTVRLPNGQLDSNRIHVPVSVKLDSSKWYQLYARITKQGFNLDSLKIKDSFVVNFGTEIAKNLWQKIFPSKAISCEVISANPNSTTTSMRSYSYQPETPFLLKRGVIFIEGALGGLVAYKILTK